ncbi:MaoC/PaaZ C-terminal domain-containing protein [Rhodococcoides kyotonense]|uniref:Acyl dehydratase n=1 Tax=Rhodococcoides kyotonense TaxID=398843 RepID=A0A239N3B2_9NOCA|nr:MaoC/PaaZ C-terminal domain-containing protein [Rhodococcus kyotonensis]SNT48953.1 Acyl dehydratase [Rhodococcus kyotonensis]
MSNKIPRQGLLYEDLYVGLAFRSPGRTITDYDIIGFAGLTGDYSEVHTSDVYAQSSQFGKRIAHGMMGLAYAHGLMWPRTEMLRHTAIAFLGISDWRFVAPIFLGDTIFVEYSVAAMRDSKSNPEQAIVTFDVQVVDQDGRLCQRGQKVELLSKVPLDGVTASGAHNE